MNQILENPHHASPARQANTRIPANLWQALRNETKGKLHMDPGFGFVAFVILLVAIGGFVFRKKVKGDGGGQKNTYKTSNSLDYNLEDCDDIAKKLETYLKKIELENSLVPNLAELSKNKTGEQLKDWFAGFRILILKAFVNMAINMASNWSVANTIQYDNVDNALDDRVDPIFQQFDDGEKELEIRAMSLERELGTIQIPSIVDVAKFDIEKLKIQKQRIVNHIAFLENSQMLLDRLIKIISKKETDLALKEVKINSIQKLKANLSTISRSLSEFNFIKLIETIIDLNENILELNKKISLSNIIIKKYKKELPLHQKNLQENIKTFETSETYKKLENIISSNQLYASEAGTKIITTTKNMTDDAENKKNQTMNNIALEKAKIEGIEEDIRKSEKIIRDVIIIHTLTYGIFQGAEYRKEDEYNSHYTSSCRLRCFNSNLKIDFSISKFTVVKIGATEIRSNKNKFYRSTSYDTNTSTDTLKLFMNFKDKEVHIFKYNIS